MAEETKWTPGPWLVVDGGGQLSNVPAHIVKRAQNGTPWFICDLQDDLDVPGIGGDALANANLIATAPDGFALAKRVIDYFGDAEIDPRMDCDIDLREMARTLVSKALGVSP